MALAAGSKVGPYDIVGVLGAGGMGEVYRAHDPRLHRTVAIKVISHGYASDPDRLRRFEQEARAAAAVTHPALLSVFDIGTHEGEPYIVSELLEGATLRERLAGGPMPLSRVVPLGLQIAQGLAAAHDHGIVHRDLKPENIFITDDGRAKILDFGVAKLTGDAFAQAEVTVTAPAKAIGTKPGTVIGTIGYMAPEQLRCAPVDGRADIFAFGAILYEMLSGRRAFGGDTSADAISAILSTDPPDITPSATHVVPDGLQRIVRHALEKMPERRFQSARDLAFAIEAVATQTGAPMTAAIDVPRSSRKAHGSLPWKIATAVLAAGLLASAVFIIGARRGSVVEMPIAQFSVLDPTEAPWDIVSVRGDPAKLSPDGTMIATVRRGGGGDGYRIWVRPLNALSAVPLTGADSVRSFSVVWSPDSRNIVFASGETLRRISLSGGPAQPLGQIPAAYRPAAWGSAGVILLTNDNAILQMPESGGPVAQLRAPDPAKKETALYTPVFLPDGRHYLVSIESSDEAHAGVFAGSLDTGELVPVLTGVHATGIAYAPPGYLIYARWRHLLVRRFDAAQLKVQGGEILLTDTLHTLPGAHLSLFSVSQTGVLAFAPYYDESVRFTQYDETGRRARDIGEVAPYENFSLSRDGRTIAAALRDPASGGSDIWTIDSVRSVASRLTTSDAAESDPIWSPDGDIAFSSIRDTKTIFVTRAVAGKPERVAGLGQSVAGGGVDAWSPDGKWLLVHSGLRLELLPMRTKGAPVVAAEVSSGRLDEADFSPDGRWISYNTVSTEVSQVFVVPNPATGERWQISNAGGVQARWSHDGRHLYYLSTDAEGTMMEVDLPSGHPRDASAPRPLFRTGLRADPAYDQYRVLPDGGFVIAQPVRNAQRRHVVIVLNWPALAREREK